MPQNIFKPVILNKIRTIFNPFKIMPFKITFLKPYFINMILCSVFFLKYSFAEIWYFSKILGPKSNVIFHVYFDVKL